MADHSYCGMKFQISELQDSEDEMELEIEENEKNFDEILIDAVRGYPHLYNHKLKEFKDQLMKENSWKEISLCLDMPVTDCQTRWTRLRERFGKEKRLREEETRSGSGASRRGKFPFAESMSFLNNHVKRRKVFTNFITTPTPVGQSIKSATVTSAAAAEEGPASPAPTNDVAFPSCTNFSTSFDGNAEFSDESVVEPETTTPKKGGASFTKPVTVMTPRMTPKLKPKKKAPTSDLENALSLLCQKMNERVTNTNPTNNSDNEIFGLFVARQLDRLPPSEVVRRQKAITDILFEPFN